MNDLVLQTLSKLDEENNEMTKENAEMSTKDIIEYLCPQRSASRDLGIISEGRIPEKTIWSSERSDMWETIIGEQDDEDLSNLSQSFLTVLEYENPSSVYSKAFTSCGDKQVKKDLKEIFENSDKMKRLKNSVLDAINRLILGHMTNWYDDIYECFVENMVSNISGLGITRELLYRININRLGEEFLNRRPIPHERLFDGFEIEGDELVKK